MKKRITAYTSTLAIAILVGALSPVKAQHELSVYGGGGLSTLKYKTDAGDQKNGYGGLFGLGYTYFFADKLGVSTGVEIGLYNAKTNINNFAYRYMAVDRDGDDFEFRTRINSREEKQRAMLLQIPLMLKYQSGKKINFSGALGAKLGIPISAKYKTNGAGITNSGYYAYEDYEYTEQTFMGFGTFTAQSMDDDIDLKPSIMLSAEAGIKWPLGQKTSLYTGAYFDYGINDSNDGDSRQLVLYNTQSPTAITTNSVLMSRYGNQPAADKVHPMAFGVKVGLAFGISKSSKEPKIHYHEPIGPTQYELEQAEARRKAEQEETKRRAEQIEREAREKVDAEAKARQQAEEARLRAEQAYRETVVAVEKPVTGYSVDGTAVLPSQRSELDEKAKLLNENPSIRIVVEGHTCDLGTDAVNEVIGLQRAEAAAKYLEEKGIDANRITVVSKREAEPLVPNTSPENRKINRRVVVKVVD